MNPVTTGEADIAQARRPVLGYWPAALGLAAAAFQVLGGVATADVAITLAVATICYLAAAALGLPWVAWAGIPAGSIVVIVSELAGIAWWLGLTVFAIALVVAGARHRLRFRATATQALALVGFGGLAVVAVFISPRLGLALAGAALASHAVWDYLHWRRNAVVPRSLAEFCFVLDIPFGVAAIALALTG